MRRVSIPGRRRRDAHLSSAEAFSARTTINRSDFGLTWNQLLEAGGVAVADRIEISIEIEDGEECRSRWQLPRFPGMTNLLTAPPASSVRRRRCRLRSANASRIRQAIRRIFADVKTIAVVGCHATRGSRVTTCRRTCSGPATGSFRSRRTTGTVLGERTWPDLASVPVPVDLALVFRPGPQCLKVAEQAIAAGVPRIWFQLHIPAGEGARRAAAAGLEVVADRCMMVEHRTFVAAGLTRPGLSKSGLSKRRPTGQTGHLVTGRSAVR